MSEVQQADENRRQQVRLYGAPLSDVFGSIGSNLALSQGETARLLGLSAPMLSHLISARRVKIGNPVASARLAQLRALSDEVAAGQVPPEQLAARLQTIGDASSALTAGETTALRPRVEAALAARDVQDLFRSVAGAVDWLEVAALAETRHPAVAEVLRVYGAGRTADAEQHWRRTLER